MGFFLFDAFKALGRRIGMMFNPRKVRSILDTIAEVADMALHA